MAKIVQLFTSASEFQNRPDYVPRLTCGPDDLGDILGKYPLPKSEYLACGLNGCNQPHGHGFLIVLKDGRETHCGSTCGAKAFGEAWDQVEAAYRAAEDADLRRSRLAGFLAKRNAMLSAAQAQESELFAMATQLRQVTDGLGADRALSSTFDAVARDGGRIRVESAANSELANGQRSDKRANLVTIDTLRGAESPAIAASVRQRFRTEVLQPLVGLTEDHIGSRNETELKRLSKQLGDIDNAMNVAREHQAAAALFLAPANLNKLWKLRSMMNRRDFTARTARVLKRVAGPEAVVPPQGEQRAG